MGRSFHCRGLVVLASMMGLILGCTSGSSVEGDLPATRVATPDELNKLQKKLEQEKVSKGVQYKAPPGVSIPKR